MVARTLVLVAALLLGSSEAAASALLQVVQPAGGVINVGMLEVFGTAGPKRILIHNAGDDIPHAVDIDVGAPFLIVAQGGSLAPGSSMYWDVVANPRPEDQGSSGTSFDLRWKDAPVNGQDQLTTVPLLCAVIPGPYQAPNHMFGNVAQGALVGVTIPVTNTSAVPRVIDDLLVVGTPVLGPFLVQLPGGVDVITVPPGGTFEIDVAFLPDTAGHFVGDIGIFDDIGGGFHYGFRVTGDGTSVQIAVSDSLLQFGDTYRYPSTPPSADVQVTNVGTINAQLPVPAFIGPGFALVAGPTSGVLVPQATVTYRVAFVPQEARMFRSKLSLGELGHIALWGRGVLRPVSTVTTLDFGTVEVGATAQRSIMIHNAGAVEILVGGLQITDPRFSVVSTDLAVPPNGDLVIELEYAPTAGGVDQAELAIAFDNDPDPQLTVALTGEGLPPVAPPDQDGGGCSTHGGGTPLPAVVLALVLAFARIRGHRPRTARTTPS